MGIQQYTNSGNSQSSEGRGADASTDHIFDSTNKTTLAEKINRAEQRVVQKIHPYTSASSTPIDQYREAGWHNLQPRKICTETGLVLATITNIMNSGNHLFSSKFVIQCLGLECYARSGAMFGFRLSQKSRCRRPPACYR